MNRRQFLKESLLGAAPKGQNPYAPPQEPYMPPGERKRLRDMEKVGR